MHTNKSFHIVLVLFLAITWGYSWPLMKIGLDSMGPFTFSFLRFLIGGICLFLILMLFKRSTLYSISIKKWLHISILGFLQTFSVFGLITYAMLFIEAGKTSVILYTMPIWTSILAALMLKEKVTMKNTIGLFLGVVGLVLIVGTDLYYQVSVSHIIGIGLIILASVVWAFANIYFRMTLTEVNQFPVTTFQMIVGSIGLGVLSLLLENPETAQWNLESIFSITFTGLVASALCFTIWYYLLRVISTVTAAISTLLVPVFGVLFGHLILRESLTISMIIGGLFILSGIFINQASFEKIRLPPSIYFWKKS